MTPFEGGIFDSRGKVVSQKHGLCHELYECYLIFFTGLKRSLRSGTILFMSISFMTIDIHCGRKWSSLSRHISLRQPFCNQILNYHCFNMGHMHFIDKPHTHVLLLQGFGMQ